MYLIVGCVIYSCMCLCRSRLKAKNLMYVNHILDILHCLIRAVTGIYVHIHNLGAVPITCTVVHFLKSCMAQLYAIHVLNVCTKSVSSESRYSTHTCKQVMRIS